MNDRVAHGQTDPNKTGPKPKQLVEGTILGLPVGRDRTVVPPDQVYELAAIGCTDGEIAGFFGVNEDTLRYNFKSELTKGREYVKIRLRKAMFHNACVNHNAAVQIFLAKQASILGMSDTGGISNDTALPWNETLQLETDNKDDKANDN
jgi:hypothetical protein